MDKNHILCEIKRLAQANDGKTPGSGVFERATGIKKSDWYPHLWLRWSDAVIEAGFTPNKFIIAMSDEVLIQSYIGLMREIQKVPVAGEIQRKSKADKSFPSGSVFDRLGGKEKLLKAVVDYCKEHQGHEDIITLCLEYKRTLKRGPEADQGTKSKVVTGYVYLMQSGRHYKIGRTNSIGGRESVLKIQIPVPPRTIHSIETDDPKGIEAYWHKRFSNKRRGTSEWFDLSVEDIQAFKRWKRIV